jgi:hypothetical protein
VVLLITIRISGGKRTPFVRTSGGTLPLPLFVIFDSLRDRDVVPTNVTLVTNFKALPFSSISSTDGQMRPVVLLDERFTWEKDGRDNRLSRRVNPPLTEDKGLVDGST